MYALYNMVFYIVVYNPYKACVCKWNVQKSTLLSFSPSTATLRLLSDSVGLFYCSLSLPLSPSLSFPLPPSLPPFPSSQQLPFLEFKAVHQAAKQGLHQRNERSILSTCPVLCGGHHHYSTSSKWWVWLVGVVYMSSTSGGHHYSTSSKWWVWLVGVVYMSSTSGGHHHYSTSSKWWVWLVGVVYMSSTSGGHHYSTSSTWWVWLVGVVYMSSTSGGHHHYQTSQPSG